MLITALEISDYMRVRKVAIKPDADRHLILIGGQNRQGKSSTLNALTAAFGGAKAITADPVRHGAEEAAIYVELDGGKLTIDRVVHPDGKTTLEVRDAEGAVRRPQEVLDKLVGARFLDPLAFLRLKAPEQRAQLTKLIDGAGRIESLDEKRRRAFDRRTELGRDLAKARGELERLPQVVGTLPPIDVAALLAEREKYAEQQRVGDALGALQRADEVAAAAANDRVGIVLAEIEQLNRRLDELKEKLPELEADLKEKVDAVALSRHKLGLAAAAWRATAAAREQLDRDVARAGDHNRGVFEAEAQNKRRVEAQAAVAKLEGEVEQLTGVLKTIDERKAEVLAAAKLPVEGLAIGDDGLSLAGVPFAQASASEQLRVALALAIAGSPGLHDVWIRDGALLDDESLDLVAKHAAAAGKRVWIERVGTKDPGVIVIQDGQVVP
jgi:DNA repair exonuclease SbcCD ATPase subunit